MRWHRNWQRGNLDVSLDVSSENEIGELADSIQKTVNRLKEYINYIDEIAYVLNRLSDGKLKFTLKNTIMQVILQK